MGRDGLQGHGDLIFKLLRGGLGQLTKPTEAAAPMMGQPLQIQHLCPGTAKGMEHIRFAAAGVAPQQNNGARLGQALAQPTAKRLIATLQEGAGQVTGFQEPGGAAAAESPPPAVDPHLAVIPCQSRGLLRQWSKPWSHQRQSMAHRGGATLVMIEGPHSGPLLIAEQGKIVGARDVATGKLSRATHIQQGTT